MIEISQQAMDNIPGLLTQRVHILNHLKQQVLLNASLLAANFIKLFAYVVLYTFSFVLNSLSVAYVHIRPNIYSAFVAALPSTCENVFFTILYTLDIAVTTLLSPPQLLPQHDPASMTSIIKLAYRTFRGRPISSEDAKKLFLWLPDTMSRRLISRECYHRSIPHVSGIPWFKLPLVAKALLSRRSSGQNLDYVLARLPKAVVSLVHSDICEEIYTRHATALATVVMSFGFISLIFFLLKLRSYILSLIIRGLFCLWRCASSPIWLLVNWIQRVSLKDVISYVTPAVGTKNTQNNNSAIEPARKATHSSPPGAQSIPVYTSTPPSRPAKGPTKTLRLERHTTTFSNTPSSSPRISSKTQACYSEMTPVECSDSNVSLANKRAEQRVNQPQLALLRDPSIAGNDNHDITGPGHFSPPEAHYIQSNDTGINAYGASDPALDEEPFVYSPNHESTAEQFSTNNSTQSEMHNFTAVNDRIATSEIGQLSIPACVKDSQVNKPLSVSSSEPSFMPIGERTSTAMSVHASEPINLENPSRLSSGGPMIPSIPVNSILASDSNNANGFPDGDSTGLQASIHAPKQEVKNSGFGGLADSMHAHNPSDKPCKKPVQKVSRLKRK